MGKLTTISVDTGRVLGAVDRRIFGGFIEHLGRCIYGGVYEPGSPLSDSRGFREDVLELMKRLRLSVLRWPGGNFVSNYHWRDGVGPAAERPERSELAWGGTEPNTFGTDEYISYCRELGAEPYICLNMGTGSLEEALAWVEYCNSDRQTHWADLRRSNGQEEPFNVPWWGLGNEIYGAWQVGALSAGEYIAEATRWARAIRMLDPHAKLVSCGELGWTDWDVKVIDALAPYVDLHSIHIYTGSDDYWTNVLSPHAAERAIQTASMLLRRSAYKHHLPRAPRLAYDEWNIWFRAMDGGLEERYNFSDALAVGTFLNIFVRNSAWVAIANMAQMVNAIAPIVTSTDAAVAQPIYFPFLLHSQGHLTEAVDAFVEGPRVAAPEEHMSRWRHRIDDLGPFDLVDVAATVDSERANIALTLVNRSEDVERVEVVLKTEMFARRGRLQTVVGSDRPSPVPGVQEASTHEGEVEPKDAVVVLDLLPKSFTLFESGITRR